MDNGFQDLPLGLGMAQNRSLKWIRLLIPFHHQMVLKICLKDQALVKTNKFLAKTRRIKYNKVRAAWLVLFSINRLAKQVGV